MNQLANLSRYSPGELECAIDRELKPLCMCLYYPDFENKISGPNRPHERPLPIVLELPTRRSYGRIDAIKSTMWLFRYDTSYTIICTAPVLQRKLEALAVLSDDDVIFSTAQEDGSPLLMVKFNNHDSLAMVVTVLRQALFAENQDPDQKVWHI
ncbi:hypothetical protein BH11CYA1_BH11CYA1_06850 [soil metagenome]